MTAQPAPVTPPPEPWTLKAATEIARALNDNQCLPGAFATCLRILLKHAPPPAPSCPTEGVGSTEGVVAKLRSQLRYADMGKAKLRVEVAQLKRALADQMAVKRTAASTDTSPLPSPPALSRQPAPSAGVSSRTGEGVERLERVHLHDGPKAEEHAKTLADAISLLSQPAVAQTEAGNDMTLREFVCDLSTHGLRFDLNPTHNLNDPEVFWHSYFRRANDSIKERATSVLSESSPKSVSVPAVAGGGEAAAMIARECAMKNIGLEGWEYTDLRSYDRGEVDTLTESILRAISDAVKGSGAVEALDDLLHHGQLIHESDAGNQYHQADPHKAELSLIALRALTLPDQPTK